MHIMQLTWVLLDWVHNLTSASVTAILVVSEGNDSHWAV